MWIDFEVPDLATYDPEEGLVLEAGANLDGDTGVEMNDRVRRRAFPELSKVYDHTDLDAINAADLVAAAERDVKRHERRLEGLDVGGDADGVLRRVRLVHFRQNPSGRFVKVPAVRMNAFLRGERAERLTGEQVVGVVVVDVITADEVPLSARVSLSLRVRSVDGKIDPVHSALAFGREEGERSTERFRARRNEAIRWNLSERDLAALERAIRKHVGDVAVLPSES